MDSDQYSSEDEAPMSAKKKSKSKLSVERVYQRKSQLEHILLRPDTYIGSVEMETKQQMWVYDEGVGMSLRDVTFVPGLYKIFDEILVNAADNKQRDRTMNVIRVDIDVEKNEISVYNNGKGIPVVEHKVEHMWVPTLIFGHLLTSSNYNDEEKKVVGGRNGYGAKLCNVFSNKFSVQTSCKEYKKAFSQSWSNNMRTAGAPKITEANGEDFTRIKFQPDLAKFQMQELDKDIVALFSRRAYDVAGSVKGVKVFLNGKRLPVNGFKDYVDQFIKDREDESGNPLKMAHEVVNDRWEIAVTVSDKGYQQISFVNSIATTRGGKHVDYVSDQIITKMSEIIKKKNKMGVNVKPFQIKNHLWVFINCLIENPTFDSQTKETMTLQTKSFGSKCVPTEKFFVAVNKIGVVESIMTWVKFKAETELAKSCHSKKHARLNGIPKLEDANDAGTKNSSECTLILTEGDSAKSLVISGLAVVGRDKYGVFPLRGKMLNVREASHKQILENAEINNLIKIMGLQYKKKYETKEDLKSLRYGKIMIMTDQDQDGSHIKGLLINFVHHNWPSLLKMNFLEEFITPIVKVSKGSECKSFYSLPEFEEWKKATNNWSSWKVKYYKGLGTSTSNEAKEYFNEMNRHRITFKYNGPDDDHAVVLAFSKKMIERRKDWLTNGMEERKRRRELGMSEIYLYEKDTRSVSYKDFVNKELILFSNMDNERSIPSIMDGFKPGQRKVLFTCLKRNDKREVKVAQLAGSVGEHSAYHHGEVSLMSTIINLAQNFVGSNNINLLQPLGQFGTRLQGGKDAASPRYIFTMLSPLARIIFNPLDEPLLNNLYDDNQKIEPEYYVPILPMVLVNGAEGIGTGWSTRIPNYNPSEIVMNLKRMINGEEPEPMKPWFKGFLGTIVQIDSQRFVVNGQMAVIDSKTIEITELPVRTWTQTYKESTLEVLLHGNKKNSAFISDYKEYHTDSTVRFVVQLAESNLENALQSGAHKIFKLQSSLATTSMVLFDHNGCLRRYETPEDILKEYFPIRLEFYVKRKAYYEGMLAAEVKKLENQARFILEKNAGKIVMENIKKTNFVRKLIECGYDSDPVKGWKLKNGISIKEDNSEQENNDYEDYNDNDSAFKKDKDDHYDYDYLFDMTMRSMLREKVEELLKKRDAKKEELEKLMNSTPEQLWEEDLNALLQEMEIVERQEKYAEQSKPIKLTSKSNVRLSKSKLNKVAEESKPSAFAERVEPKIDVEIYKKCAEIAKKSLKKKRKENGDESPVREINDSDDDIDKPLAERIGTSPQIIDEKKAKLKNVKSIKVNLNLESDKEKLKKKQQNKSAENNNKKRKSGSMKKKRNPWSESDSDDDEDVQEFLDSEDEDEYIPVNSSTRPLKNQEVNEKSKKSFKKDDLITSFDTTVSFDKESNEEINSSKDNSDDKRKNAYDSDEDLINSDKTTSNKRTSEELFDAIISRNANERPFKPELNGINELNASNANTEKYENDVFLNETNIQEKRHETSIIKNKPTKASKKAFDSESDDDLFNTKLKPKSKPTKASKKAFDSGTDEDLPKSKQKKVKPIKIKRKTHDESSSDFEEDKVKPTKKKKSKKTESFDLDNFDVPFEMRTTTGRVRQPVKYNFGEDTTDED